MRLIQELTSKVHVRKFIVLVAILICLSAWALGIGTVKADPHLSPYQTYTPTLTATHGMQGANGFEDNGYEWTITGTGWDPIHMVNIDCSAGKYMGIAASYPEGAGCPESLIICPQSNVGSEYCVNSQQTQPVYMTSDGSFSFQMFLSISEATPGTYQISAYEYSNCVDVPNAGEQCDTITASAPITVPGVAQSQQQPPQQQQPQQNTGSGQGIAKVAWTVAGVSVLVAFGLGAIAVAIAQGVLSSFFTSTIPKKTPLQTAWLATVAASLIIYTAAMEALWHLSEHVVVHVGIDQAIDKWGDLRESLGLPRTQVLKPGEHVHWENPMAPGQE